MLLAGAWQHHPAADYRVGTHFRWGAAEIEFTFVVSNPDGGTIIPFDEPVQWSADPFGADRRTLMDVTARVIPLPVLLAGKQSFNSRSWPRTIREGSPRLRSAGRTQLARTAKARVATSKPPHVFTRQRQYP